MTAIRSIPTMSSNTIVVINYHISNEKEREEEKQNEYEYYSKKKSRKNASTKFKLFLPWFYQNHHHNCSIQQPTELCGWAVNGSLMQQKQSTVHRPNRPRLKQSTAPCGRHKNLLPSGVDAERTKPAPKVRDADRTEDAASLRLLAAVTNTDRIDRPFVSGNHYHAVFHSGLWPMMHHTPWSSMKYFSHFKREYGIPKGNNGVEAWVWMESIDRIHPHIIPIPLVPTNLRPNMCLHGSSIRISHRYPPTLLIPYPICGLVLLNGEYRPHFFECSLMWPPPGGSHWMILHYHHRPY